MQCFKRLVGVAEEKVDELGKILIVTDVRIKEHKCNNNEMSTKL